MSTTPDDQGLWSWLYEESDKDEPDLARVRVTALVLGGGQNAGIDTGILARSTVRPAEVVYYTGPDTPIGGEWVWLLTPTADPEPDALEKLLLRALGNPRYEVVGALSLEPRSRIPVDVIRTFGLTVAGSGRVRSLTYPGELQQGQLRPTPALGAPVSGLLVRTSLWEFLGGVNPALPQEVWGLDFGWRANLSGAEVVIEPDAEVVSNSFVDLAAERAGGLALMSAHTRAWLRPLRWVSMTFWTLVAAAGFLLGKDFWRAGQELRGWFRWATGRVGRGVGKDLAVLPITPASAKATKKLLPSPWRSLRRAAHLAAERFSDWAGSFVDRIYTGEDDITIDDMTSDEFTAGAGQRRVSPVVVGLGVSLVGALAAARNLFGEGYLRGAWLLPPAQDAFGLLGQYLDWTPGDPASASPPWTGLFALASFVTAGQPDLLAAILLIAGVPLSWLAAYRLARTLVDDHLVPAIAAAGYALLPAASGALNAGGLGVVVWTLLLPLLGYSWHWWRTAGAGSWRGAAELALWLLIGVAFFPPAWPLVLVVAALALRKARSLKTVAQWLLVVASPALLLFSPWTAALVEWPGRLLSGISPVLRQAAAAPPWQIPLIYGHGEFGPPLWVLSACGALWLIAFLGAFRRKRARWALAAATVAAATAIAASHLVIEVNPGVSVNLDVTELTILMGGALLLSVVLGFQGLTRSLRKRTMGLRHLGMLGVTALGMAGILLVGGWWVWAGQTQVERAAASELPAFVANALSEAAPHRVLALRLEDDMLSWALVTDHSLRLGEAETGNWLGGSAELRQQAENVVRRLGAGSEDDELLPDLQALNVAFIWLRGGTQDVITGISNTPGLGSAVGAEDMSVWDVPDSPAIPAAAEHAYPWWAWWQLGGLALLVIVALPEVRVRTDARAPKRGLGDER
ncbi:MAG: hypothetical protein LBQ92_04855 [Propionibacteriaceae bacterium]|nr:hypothetical protein [Propionibacteriaceae bacterium]